MNVSPDGFTVRLKTEPEELFELEKSGAKPNTVRILDVYEANQIRRKSPTKIIIQHQQEIFLRTITNVYVSEMILGKYLAIFSWTNEKHHHTTQNETERDPYRHTTSLDDPTLVEDNTSEILPQIHSMSIFDEPAEDPPTALIPLPRALIADLMRFRVKRTLPEFISELLADYEVHLENGERNDFVPVTISESMLQLLQSIAHGRSMNSVIQELYQIYLDKRAEEVGYAT